MCCYVVYLCTLFHLQVNNLVTVLLIHYLAKDVIRMLRNAETADTEITDEFIDRFAIVLGSRWPLFASLLSFTTDEIWQITNNVIGKPSVKAATMMKRWRDNASATFGILTDKVKHGYLYIVGYVLYYCFF